MNPEVSMSVDERRKILIRVQARYRQASRRVRSRMLDERQAITGLHRKSLIRLLRGDLRRKPRRRQRGPTYGLKVREAIRLCAQALDDPCAERLQPVLVATARHLARHGHLRLDESKVLKQYMLDLWRDLKGDPALTLDDLRAWRNQGRLLVLLDGLDEVDATQLPRVREAIRLCAQALDDPCAKRLQPVLATTARHGHWRLDDETEAALARVSVSTIRRIVGPVRRCAPCASR